jgi:hypothetical protein
MNHAICLQCGTGKSGAGAKCPRCGFKPEKTEDKAKSVLLSDRCASLAQLEKVGKKIAAGQKLQFDDSDVHKWSDVIEAIPKPRKTYAGLSARHWKILAGAVGAAVVFGFIVFSMQELM